MNLLAIETSTQICAVALTENEHLLAEHRINIKNVHAARLFPVIRAVLDSASFEQQELNGIAVSIGPGSFTGLRIGLSAAKGLALGLGIPLVAVPTLQVLASQAPIRHGHICAVLQARVDEYYAAVYLRQNYKDRLIKETQIYYHDELYQIIPDDACLIGHTSRLQEVDVLKHGCFFAPQAAGHLSAFAVARIGGQKLLKGEFATLETVEPMYHQQFIAGKPKKSVV